MVEDFKLGLEERGRLPNAEHKMCVWWGRQAVSRDSEMDYESRNKRLTLWLGPLYARFTVQYWGTTEDVGERDRRR